MRTLSFMAFACLFLASCAGSRSKEGSAPAAEAVAADNPHVCTLKAEPTKVKPGQSFKLTWNTVSENATFFSHHHAGVRVPSAGSRTMAYSEPGEYVYGIGTVGETGGYLPSCAASVIVSASPKGRGKLKLVSQTSGKSGLVDLKLTVNADPAAGCKGMHTLGFGDGNFQTLPAMKGCRQEWSGSQLISSGKVTATLYRGSLAESAAGKAKVLAELPISIKVPAPQPQSPQ